jgi:hypothetical protein
MTQTEQVVGFARVLQPIRGQLGSFPDATEQMQYVSRVAPDRAWIEKAHE